MYMALHLLISIGPNRRNYHRVDLISK